MQIYWVSDSSVQVSGRHVRERSEQIDSCVDPNRRSPAGAGD